jgi:hypothetical protein
LDRTDQARTTRAHRRRRANRAGIAAASIAALAAIGGTTVATASGGSADVHAAGSNRADLQTTTLMSKALDGGLPNGASTNAVISVGDRRYNRIIAFESTATNLTTESTNGIKNLFAIVRSGRYVNDGSEWRPGPTVLVSRGLGGQPANGPSWKASIDGDFRHQATCIAFLSAASNLVRGDTNGRVDAFLVRRPGAAPRRISLLPRNKQSTADVTDVAVSSDCARVSFVAGNRLYTRVGNKTVRVSTAGTPAHLEYGIGFGRALVFDAPRGVYLSEQGTKRPTLVAPGGKNPTMNDIRTRILAYEKPEGGHIQIFLKDLGRRKPERVISRRGGALGNGDSTKPIIGNQGLYVTFESNATNLQTGASGRAADTSNGKPDTYLYTNVRDITLVESVKDYGEPLPGGGQNPSMAYYANYILFDSPAPLGASAGDHQVYMRYLGPL